jgi:hypothetical protein
MEKLAAHNISAPEPFDFTNPGSWEKWKRRFSRFRMASQLHRSSGEEQVNTLLYLMGDKADDILIQFKLSVEDSVNYECVIKRFDEYFAPKVNVVFERAKFNNRVQGNNETVADFITDLHNLSEKCSYGSLKEELIRDRIVVGIVDKKLSEKMQMDDKLTLDSATSLVKQSEEVRKQQDTLHFSSYSTVDRVGGRTRTVNTSLEVCQFCNLSTHERNKCPARSVLCHQCGVKGHFKRACRQKPEQGRDLGTTKLYGKTDKKSFRVRELEEQQPADRYGSDTSNGSLAEVHSGGKFDWTVEIMLRGRNITFKIDTGSDVTAVPARFLDQDRVLHKPTKVLTTADGSKLKCIGVAEETLLYKSHSVVQPVYYIENLERPLLGKRAVEELRLLVRVNNVDEKGSASILAEFPKLFQGVGKIPGSCKIRLKEDSKPVAVTSPRRVPIPLRGLVKEKLDLMEANGIISKVSEPTDWCSPLVVVPKKTSHGKKDIRLCVDLRGLNSCVKREYHPIPDVSYTLGLLANAKYFSKLDAESGFHQIELDENSRDLTAFITPYGRYRFNRLPFGITSAPEHFQRRMNQILDGCDGVVCLMDDVLIFGKTKQEHDKRLRTVLSKIENSGMTLNRKKTQICQTEIEFLGHLIDKDGIRIHPSKVDAILKLNSPKNLKELQSLLGMVNFISKAIPRRSELLAPLYDLLKQGHEFFWDSVHERVFQRLKKVLTTAPVLSLFDPSLRTVVSVDASSFGIGGVILQDHNGVLKPVSFVSRTLTDTEKRYSQIEKEALAAVWVCARLEDYIVGLDFELETDHKPLVPIFSSPVFDSLSPRLQRFRLRMMRYSFDIVHVPGRLLAIADLLSRNPLDKVEPGDDVIVEEAEACMEITLTDGKKNNDRIFDAQQTDSECIQVRRYVVHGWPDREEIPHHLLPFYDKRSNLSVYQSILLMDDRLVIPKELRQRVLESLHRGHLGITKCRSKAKDTVWWPRISQDIATMVEKCPECATCRVHHKEPIIQIEMPRNPWESASVDLFKVNGKWFLLMIDRFSRYPEVEELSNLTMDNVISKMSGIMARHGVPKTIMTDCGTQFEPFLGSPKFNKFQETYGFTLITSSPKYPQANGLAEAGVKIVKNIMMKETDYHMGLLAYRNSQLENGFTPAQLSMGRRLRDTVPILEKHLVPRLPSRTKVFYNEKLRRERIERNYNNSHKARALRPLLPGENVWIKDRGTTGIVSNQTLKQPRSYLVHTEKNTVRRNRTHLVPIKPKAESPSDRNSGSSDVPPQSSVSGMPPSQESGPVLRRSNRVPKPVERLNL